MEKNGLEKRAKNGDVESMLQLAKLYHYQTDEVCNPHMVGGMIELDSCEVQTPDYENAIKWYSEAVKRGNAEAAHNLAMIYYYSDGISHDIKKRQGVYLDKNNAIKLLKISSNSIPDDMSLLGHLYHKGVKDKDGFYEDIILEKDDNIARKLLETAYKNGSKKFIYELGLMYDQGWGGEININKANEIFEDCIIKKNSDYLALELGNLYHAGKEGVKKDYNKAFKWYTFSANKGNAEAMYNLGVMYYAGQGVEVSAKNAKKWFKKSCDNGFEDACERYERLNEDVPF